MARFISAPLVAGIAIFLQQPVFEVSLLNPWLALLGGLVCIAAVVLIVVAIFAAIIGNKAQKEVA